MWFCQRCNTEVNSSRRKYCDECNKEIHKEKSKIYKMQKRAIAQANRKCEECKNQKVEKGKLYCSDCRIKRKLKFKRESSQRSRDIRRKNKICEFCKKKEIPKGSRNYCEQCSSRTYRNKILQEKRKSQMNEWNNLNELYSVINVNQCIDCGIIIPFIKALKYCADCKSEKQRLMCKKYKKNNKEKISKYNKKYKKNNKKTITEYNAKYSKERKKIDIQYKIKTNLRSRISKMINNIPKYDTTEIILGCSYNEFLHWMEFQFQQNFTFKNHGIVWHIDHVIPCSKFDLTQEEDQKRCFHWSNMQPLKIIDNLIKSNNINLTEQHLHEIKARAFARENNFNYLEFNRTKYF